MAAAVRGIIVAESGVLQIHQFEHNTISHFGILACGGLDRSPNALLIVGLPSKH